MLNDTVLLQAINKLVAAFQVKPLMGETFSVYKNALKNLSNETLINLINIIIANEQVFPKVATINQYAKNFKGAKVQKEKKPCWACRVLTNDLRQECEYPIDRDYFDDFIQTGLDPEVKHAIEIYGTRNWKGEKNSAWVREHLMPLPELELYEHESGFKLNPVILSHLDWRKSKGLDVGPYYENLKKEA